MIQSIGQFQEFRKSCKVSTKMKIRAKIVATIGPSSQDITVLRKLFASGVDVARLNFSHGTHQSHLDIINKIRDLSSELNLPIPILQDLQGPKLRVGLLPYPIDLNQNDIVILTNAPVNQTTIHTNQGYLIPFEVPNFSSTIQPGRRVLLDDGNLELEVTKIDGENVHAKVVLGGRLLSHKGVNLPGTQLGIAGFTEKDESDLRFGLENNIDIIALSFIRNADEVLRVKQLLNQCCPRKYPPPVIAKLELPDAINNMDEILEAADGVMVARGDLGVEMSPAVVPSIQKKIIKAARRHLKPVITATQMLDSMTNNPRPTRAEASDVANAIFDGTDAVMLSGETANGKYPVESVRIMKEIIYQAELNASEWSTCLDVDDEESHDDALSVTKAAHELACDRDVTAITVFTQFGRSALYLSKLRPGVPIFAFTPESSTYHKLGLYWGVTPFLVSFAHSVEEMIRIVEGELKKLHLSQSGQQIVLVSGFPVGQVRPPNLALLHTIN